MTKHPPNRRGINFEVGAQLEARDRLKNWYPAHIEEIDYEEGRVLIHFKRWNHRYDEWFCWDSPYLRPLEKIQLRKEGLHEEEGPSEFHLDEQVLACWSDCRFYPARVTAVHKDGTYTVKFYDGVIQTVKPIHVKAFSKDQNIVGNGRPKERDAKLSSPAHRETFKGPRKAVPEDKALRAEPRPKLPDKEGKLVGPEKGKTPDKSLPRNGKEDKENISANDGEFPLEAAGAAGTAEKQADEDPARGLPEVPRQAKRRRGRPPALPPCDPNSQTLQSIALELRRRKISKGTEVPLKRSRLGKKPPREDSRSAPGRRERNATRRRSSRLCPSGSQEAPAPDAVPPGQLAPAAAPSAHSSRTQTVQAPGDGTAPSALGLSCGSMEDRAGAPGPPSPPADWQISAVTGSVPAAALKRAGDPGGASGPAPVGLDPQFRCQVPDCLKTFRKAKLLHYHMKYFHGVERPPAPEDGPEAGPVQTRGAPASERAGHDGANRKRTPSVSLYTSLHPSPRSAPSPTDEKSEKRKASTPGFDGAPSGPRAALQEKGRDGQPDRPQRRQQDRDRAENAGKDKEKSKERKFRDFVRLKSKKKKKKKKKWTPDYPCSDDTDVSPDLSPPKASGGTRCSSAPRAPSHPGPALHRAEARPPPSRAKVTEDADGSGGDSSCESFPWSDEETSQDVDVSTNPDDEPEGEDGDLEVVRCICEVQEENDFMIQCEECLCWQHGVCMGLLEDSVPDSYTCYVCQDPPGQRPSFKYWYDKDWLSCGRMPGLPFVEDNYSHRNARKIVATHQLLGDVQRVLEVLHGLQLKMSVLQSREHPDLRLWGQPWKLRAGAEAPPAKPGPQGEGVPSWRAVNGGPAVPAERAAPRPPAVESYISSEHCYQKPRAYYPAVEQKLVVETRGLALDADATPLAENGHHALGHGLGLGWEPPRDRSRPGPKARECPAEPTPVAEQEAPAVRLLEMAAGEGGGGGSQLQWQFNLLTHVESLQDQVSHRMDFIEKELDVLESWLDYTGELEPPEPLARLPQLKHCIKQLLMDLGKVQQMALGCAT
ncbi:PHD finger protein 20 isoform X2 [Ornithorhynchus anatinus]|uniref:PHD finger protein 20 isoform X2 n=1 Tax=Ornithorhynchus anatinus TaxID=9258 RepID=UPI0010A8F6CD|nr:PHD finger protein 20 isoform X2 [Ornithorhynchus anatinus]